MSAPTTPPPAAPPPPPPAGPPPSSPTGPPPSSPPAPEVPGPSPRAGRVGEVRWHYRRSLASRVTLLTTIAVGLSVAFLAAGVYVTARMQLQDQLDQSLLTRAEKTATAGLLGGSVNVPPQFFGASDVRIFIARADGVVTSFDGRGGAPLVGRPEFDVATGQRDQSVRTIVLDNGEEYRVAAVPASSPVGLPGRAVVLATSTRSQDQVLARLGGVSLLFGLLGVLGAGIAGWGVARNGLRPVRRLTTSVERIAETEVLEPLPVEGDDEIARLAAAFNDMLGALSASRDRQRRLVTDAGHELRTPLTSLRTNVDLLIQADDSQVAIDPQARGELLVDIRDQIVELTTLIGDLTELARDEPLAPVVGEVDVAEIVDVAVARVRRRALDVAFEVETAPWDVVGEAPALERAITNLLDNAAKWSPAGGTVRVRLAEGTLWVDDEGPGITEADRERVFDRFWRAAESRTMPGSGLGLSIVRQVAERHGGSVTAAAAPGGGARLVMQLPGRPG